MVAEVALMCGTVILLSGMAFLYMERNKPKAVQTLPELEKIKDDIRILESRVNALNMGRLR
jgi:hypothetical protein